MKEEQVSKINPDNYIGNKVKTIKAEYIDTKFGPAVKIISEVIPLHKDDEMDKDLTASRIFGLSRNKETDEVIIAEGGVFSEWLKAHNVKSADLPDYELNAEIDVLVGIECTVQKNKNNYLELA